VIRVMHQFQDYFWPFIHIVVLLFWLTSLSSSAIPFFVRFATMIGETNRTSISSFANLCITTDSAMLDDITRLARMSKKRSEPSTFV
jgi:hypothetical protein